MKIIFYITIEIEGKHIHSVLRKEYDSQLLPIPGMEFEDSAWKKAKQAESITCNFDEGCYLLYFPSVQLNTEEACKNEEDIYCSHGWKKPGMTV